MIYTRSVLTELTRLTDHDLREIGLDRLTLNASLQEMEDLLSIELEKYLKRKCEMHPQAYSM